MATSRHGSYDVTTTPGKEHRISVLAASGEIPGLNASRNPYISFGNNTQPRGEGLLDRCRMRADDFRQYLANSCCSCVEAIPSFALVILALLLIMLLIAVVPLAFALTYSSPAAQTMKTTTMTPSLPSDLEPLDNATLAMNSTGADGERDDAEEHLLMSTALIPKNISACHGFGFACASNPNQVIGTYQRCDGHLDCADGSDEIGCRECQTGFSCDAKSRSEDGPIHKVCLRGGAFCDGTHHCDDHTDELLYCKGPCKEDQLSCRNSSTCVPEWMVCDGDAHCPMADDEHNCTSCMNDAKLCAPLQTCIPKWLQCNGVSDCPDHSDEVDCDCRSCSGSGRALCTGSTTRCLLKSSICDGQEDCPGGEDEAECPGTCPALSNGTADERKDDTSLSLIKCSDGHAYTWKYACSGLFDACRGLCEQCNNETAYHCASEKRCILRAKVCNGFDDCADGSDEENCGCASESGREFECPANGTLPAKCIQQSQKCDGYHDCADGSDESECSSCANDALFCAADRSCILRLKRCDGVEDCSDGSDETNCTCEECNSHPFSMYVCQSADAGRCFRRHEACHPYSRCPNATKIDKLFCAAAFQLEHSFF